MNLRRYLLAIGAATSLASAFTVGVWAQATQKVVWRWPESMEAVVADPGEHKVLFEDGHIRLLEVSVQPGVVGPAHGHKYPSAFIYDSVQPRLMDRIIEDKTTIPRDRLFEDKDWSEPSCRTLPIQAPHAVDNPDSFPAHFYRMEFKRIDGKATMSMKNYIVK